MSTLIPEEFCLIHFQQTNKWVVVLPTGALPNQFQTRLAAYEGALANLGRESAEFDFTNISGAVFERYVRSPKVWREEPFWGAISESPYLSVRSMNALQADGFKFLSQLENKSRDQLRKIPNIGTLCANEILRAISLTKTEMEYGQ
jgi:hypothetical protein